MPPESSTATIDSPELLTFKPTGAKYATLKEVHAELKRFKLKQEKYYHLYYPRYDKLSGELIKYKDVEQYFATEFNSKLTLQRWVRAKPEEGRAWARQYLINRKKEKGLKYAPSYVELRSLNCPDKEYYDEYFSVIGGYHGLCEGLGFLRRYEDYNPVPKELPRDAVITIDTREQRPLILSTKVIQEKLDVGDYALNVPYDAGIRIERKSLPDFCSTLAPKNLARFHRELDRAVANENYVVMMVESDLTEALTFDTIPSINRYIKTNPSFIFHALRDTLNKYPLNFQCMFVNGRIEMSKDIVKILSLGKKIHKLDLQQYYYWLNTKNRAVSNMKIHMEKVAASGDFAQYSKQRKDEDFL
jgi:hypothetical protein